MHLKILGLFNFRNYISEHFEFHLQTNVIYGKNAQGKTNILEAIHFLSTLQPLRAIDSKKVIHWEKEEASLHGTFVYQDIEKHLSLSVGPQGKKAHINGTVIKKVSDYLGKVHIICFSPSDLQILQGGASLRRRYLDRAMLNVDSTYAVDIGKYYRVLLQRNTALRFERIELASLWGERLHKIGAKILLKRLQFTEKLNTLTSCLYREISGSSPEVLVQYESEILFNDFRLLNEEGLFLLLQEKQQEMNGREKQLKRSLVGPHLDDFSVFVSQRNLRFYGSQAEQRTAVLALKLSEWGIVERETGDQPIFLLDDFASELDEVRRNHFFELLQQKKTQTFVTTTDLNSVKHEQPGMALFKIEKGAIVRS